MRYRDKRIRLDGYHRISLAALLVASLAGCASHNSSDTALELMQQQKDEQTLIQQHDADVQRRQAPTQPDLMLALVREAQSQGRYFAALAYTDAYIQKYGVDIKVTALRADALRMTGQSEQSENAYRTLIQSGQAAHGWHGLGLIAGGRHDYATAVTDLRNAARLAPTDPEILSDLGFASLSNGDIAAGRVPLGQAAELDPKNPRVLSNLALLLMLDGDAAGAQRVMDQAAISPEARQRIFQLSASLQKRRTEPRLAARTPIADTPSHPDKSVIDASLPPMMSPMLERFSNGSASK
jgi:Flp pilus assembly protein TadD